MDEQVALFLQKRLYALLRRFVPSRDIIGNTLRVIGNFPIELFPRRAVGKMSSADSAGLPHQFPGNAGDFPKVTIRTHPSSPHEL